VAVARRDKLRFNAGPVRPALFTHSPPGSCRVHAVTWLWVNFTTRVREHGAGNSGVKEPGADPFADIECISWDRYVSYAY
jgi:hypothetical protein